MNSQPTAKSNQLVISALGEDKPGIIDALSRCILNSGCAIADSRMTVLRGDFAILLLVDGNWNSLAKLETQLPPLEERLGLSITTRRTSPKEPRRDLLPYGIDVAAMDQPGIVHNLASFFSQRQINRFYRKLVELSGNDQIAREAGLEPLATRLLEDPSQAPEVLAAGFVDPDRGVADGKAALDGARQILMEAWAEDEEIEEIEEVTDIQVVSPAGPSPPAVPATRPSHVA